MDQMGFFHLSLIINYYDAILQQEDVHWPHFVQPIKSLIQTFGDSVRRYLYPGPASRQSGESLTNAIFRSYIFFIFIYQKCVKMLFSFCPNHNIQQVIFLIFDNHSLLLKHQLVQLFYFDNQNLAFKASMKIFLKLQDLLTQLAVCAVVFYVQNILLLTFFICIYLKSVSKICFIVTSCMCIVYVYVSVVVNPGFIVQNVIIMFVYNSTLGCKVILISS